MFYLPDLEGVLGGGQQVKKFKNIAFNRFIFTMVVFTIIITMQLFWFSFNYGAAERQEMNVHKI